jgi:Flp pilus assembly protein TadG
MTQYWLQRRRRLLRRYRRSQSGVSAIEFAFAAPLFFALLLAIFEVGIMLFSEYIIQNGVGDAARMIRTGEVKTESEFKAQVCGRLATYLDCEGKLHVDVRSFPDFDDIDFSPPLTSDGELSEEVTGSEFDTGGSLEVVVVRVYYEWKLFAPGMTLMSNMSDKQTRLLAAGAAFRNEPFGS